MRITCPNLRRVTFAILMASACAPCHAVVTHFKIVSRTAIPAASSTRFGLMQAAEKITAHVSLEVDPADPRNSVIVDLDRAPRTADGAVSFETDVILLRPAQPNGLLVVEFPNRGNSQIYSVLSDIDHGEQGGIDQVGNGFLLAKGYTLAIVGWQGDIAPGKKLGASLPLAQNVSGFSRDEWVLPKASAKETLPLSWPIKDPASAQLVERPTENSASVTVPHSRWRLLDDRHVEITSQSAAGSHTVYELRYIAKNSAVMGLGFAAVRDVASFLEHDGSPSNPLARDGHSLITRSIVTGVSQSGRAVRDFLYWGFNCDQGGRRVFDGMLPIIPGSRRSFTNARFAQPRRNPGPEADQQYPVDQFPFTYDVLKDSLSGREDGLLLRCRQTQTCPKILEYDSEYEFWGSRASLNVTDTHGKAIALPDNVRAYMLAGAPHSNPWNAVSIRTPRCAMPSSPIAFGPVIRALLVDLDDWIHSGTLPPASRYPSVADGTLVPAHDVFPPGLPLPYTGQHMRAQWIEQTETGPIVKGEYPVLFPKSDPDGNSQAGVHLPQVAVPRATYVGWSPQTGATGVQDLCDHAAGMVPFARTKAERTAANDPRLSLEERYKSREQYEAQALRSAQSLVTERLLLKEDIDTVVAAAHAVE